MLTPALFTILLSCIDAAGLPPVSAVTVTLAQPALSLGETTVATIVATNVDGQPIDGEFDAVSDNPSVAFVSDENVVTAVAAGVANIRATVKGRTGETTVTVSDPGPTEPPPTVVTTIAVSLDSAMLLVGNAGTAVATLKNAQGAAIVGPTPIWTSLAPSVASVSESGLVTALTPGSATIQASVAGVVGATNVIVVGAPVMASSNFNDGTFGPFTGTKSVIDFPEDPTNSGHGRVARILYAPTAENTSADKYLNFHLPEAQKISYARTIWFKGELYLPKNPLNDPNWRDKDIRKLLDWQGGSDDGWTWGGARWYLARMISDEDGETMRLGLSVEKFDTLARVDDLQFFGQFGGEFATDTWHTIEVRMTTNSADGVADGVLEFFIDNPTDTPSFRATGLNFISQSIAPLDRYGVKRPGSYFNNFLVGSQLSNNAPLPLNREYRYWDNLAFATTRIGR